MIYTFKKYEPTEIMSGHLKMGGSNPNGGTIEVNSRYIVRDGKPYIGIMGEYHFSRASRENWATELQKMKYGGITIVATYLFWIYHEEEEGVWNFTQDRDIREFVRTAAEIGLDVVLRIGPWAHGECRNGGFPDWLLKLGGTKPSKYNPSTLDRQDGFVLRDNNPEYMGYVRKWYSHIYAEVKDFLYKNGGNIVAIQIENELVDNAEHIKALKELAIEIGLEAPIYTATGWNSKFGARLPVDEVMPVFGGYPDAPWAQGGLKELPPSIHYAFYPERNDSSIGADLIEPTDKDGWRLPYERYPFATCELGPGMESTHHRRVVVSAMDAYAISLVKLGAGNNLMGYYMYHGGTHKLGKLSTLNEDRASGYPNDVAMLSYDFGTCISEFGEIREQYRRLRLLHLFVQDFGDVLAPMESVPAAVFVPETDTKNLRYAMRTNGKSGFVFVNHYQRHGHIEDIKNVVIDTGIVRFPSINVKGDIAFFVPFNMTLGEHTLEYATAQPLAKEGDTYYFLSIDGIKPVYKFAGCEEGIMPVDIKVTTLSYSAARMLYRRDGKIMTEEVNDTEFIDFELEPCNEPDFRLYDYELNIGGPRKRKWYKLYVNQPDGFISIDEEYDVAQIYANGQVVCDNFYEGVGWHVPASLIYGKECHLVLTEKKDDFYLNYDDVKKLRKNKER